MAGLGAPRSQSHATARNAPFAWQCARQLHEKARLQFPIRRVPRPASDSLPSRPNLPAAVEWPAELWQAANAPRPFDPLPPL
jgi:hypothetical protein